MIWYEKHINYEQLSLEKKKYLVCIDQNCNILLKNEKCKSPKSDS